MRKPVFEAYADPRDWVAAFRRWERHAAWVSGILITEGCVGLEERWIWVLNATAYLDGCEDNLDRRPERPSGQNHACAEHCRCRRAGRAACPLHRSRTASLAQRMVGEP